MTDLYVLMTMDCENARSFMTSHGASMSPSGPPGYSESEASIKGYASIANSYRYPLSLFVHPEVAAENRDLLLDLRDQGACLGLHLHPYKFGDGQYRHDLGAYSAEEQRDILEEAISVWKEALGYRPLYFRPGYFSANDNTFRVLQELGFKGGSLSIPGRILPNHCSVWSGAYPYPHRAHLAFRQLKGMSDFIEVPVSVDYRRAMETGAAGEKGYEWPYIPADYDHEMVVRDILHRFETAVPEPRVIVLDTHNDEDYSAPSSPARQNLELILGSIVSICGETSMRPIGGTVETICDLVRSANEN